MLKKILNTSIVLVAIAIVLPIPLAYFVDLTYHWLLLVTIPFGVPVLIALIIWRVLLSARAGRSDLKEGTRGKGV